MFMSSVTCSHKCSWIMLRMGSERSEINLSFVCECMLGNRLRPALTCIKDKGALICIKANAALILKAKKALIYVQATEARRDNVKRATKTEIEEAGARM